MGQQQLFVYILVIFIIGIATVVAIDTLKNSYENANRDGVREDILFSMMEAQQYYLTHEQMDGGGKSFDGIDISDLTLGDETDKGTYALEGNGNTIIIEGWGNYEGVYLKATGTMGGKGQLDIEWEFEEESEQ